MCDYNVLNESHFLSVSLKINQYTSINNTTFESIVNSKGLEVLFYRKL